MPIEVKIPKEIREYRESIFFGLSTRQFTCSLLALSAAVGLYFVFDPLVGTESVGWICILGAAPFAACGFWTYHGMNDRRTDSVGVVQVPGSDTPLPCLSVRQSVLPGIAACHRAGEKAAP